MNLKNEFIHKPKPSETIIKGDRGLYFSIAQAMQEKGIGLSYIQKNHNDYQFKYRRFISYKNGSNKTGGVDDDTLKFFAKLAGIKFERANLVTGL